MGVAGLFKKIIMPYISHGTLIETTYERYSAFARQHLSDNPRCTYDTVQHEVSGREEVRLYAECGMYCTAKHEGPGFGWFTRHDDPSYLRLFLNPILYALYLDPGVHWLVPGTPAQQQYEDINENEIDLNAHN